MVFGFIKQCGHIKPWGEPGRGTNYRPCFAPGRSRSETVLMVEYNEKLRHRSW